jgi:predicted patatin/cPLA2 family phospholipase
MRGVYSAGALLALHLLNFRDAFDDLFGTSAGAVNGAHFLSGVGQTKVSTYYRWLDSAKFINIRRIRKVVDVDYFVDEVLTRLEKVEVELVQRARTELWVAVLNERTAEVELRNPRRDNISLLKMLKAAVAIPVLYGRTIALGEDKFMDAGFVQPFPLSSAVASGCTDLLVVTAQPVSFRSKPPSWWQSKLFDCRCARGNAKLLSLFLAGWETQNNERRLAEGPSSLCRGVNIATLAPDETRLSQTTTNPQILRAELIRMCKYVLDIFEQPHDELNVLIKQQVL